MIRFEPPTETIEIKDVVYTLLRGFTLTDASEDPLVTISYPVKKGLASFLGYLEWAPVHLVAVVEKAGHYEYFYVKCPQDNVCLQDSTFDRASDSQLITLAAFYDVTTLIDRYRKLQLLVA